MDVVGCLTQDLLVRPLDKVELRRGWVARSFDELLRREALCAGRLQVQCSDCLLGDRGQAATGQHVEAEAVRDE